MADKELMTMHVEALYTYDANSRLLHINEPDGGGLADKFFLGRTREGHLWRFRSDLPDSLVERLDLQLLEAKSVWLGPAYCFTDDIESSRATTLITEKNADLLQGGFENLISELPLWQPFVAVIENNRAVSVCRSVRITEKAHEAGLETLPEFRGRGYARDVVAAWATQVRKMGAWPIYSTSWDNKASQAVARKLNLSIYGFDFSIT
jgi:RimJ/RimL family protein N-acetyltransferase